jgi:hypothetical protein
MPVHECIFYLTHKFIDRLYDLQHKFRRSTLEFISYHIYIYYESSVRIYINLFLPVNIPTSYF